MPRTVDATSHILTFAEVIARLSAREVVDGLLTIG
jgi:hypothetical protein